MKRYVASFTDAWIETFENPSNNNYPIVASFTDAWIETLIERADSILPKVASFTDAWIETTISEEEMKIAVSHLLQMRGLKLLIML